MPGCLRNPARTEDSEVARDLLNPIPVNRDSKMPMSTSLEQRLTGHSGAARGQGPFMRVTVSIVDGVVREAFYETYQCPGCHACGKALCEMVKGKSIDQVKALRYEDLVNHVGSLPAHRRICYGLTVLALADALDRLPNDQKLDIER